MRRTMCAIGLFAVATTALVGCGDDGPELVEAGGTVTYNGAPLEGATVIFAPEKGPLATGTTDADGRYSLATGGEPGAVAGPGKVGITAVEQLMEMEQDVVDMPTDEELAKASRSLIPEKYGNVRTSGLEATVKDDGENDFTFEL